MRDTHIVKLSSHTCMYVKPSSHIIFIWIRTLY